MPVSLAERLIVKIDEYEGMDINTVTVAAMIGMQGQLRSIAEQLNENKSRLQQFDVYFTGESSLIVSLRYRLTTLDKLGAAEEDPRDKF